MYICIYNDEYASEGKTLKEAYDGCVEDHGCDSTDDVRFFEATEIQVEFLVVKKEVVSKISKTTK